MSHERPLVWYEDDDADVDRLRLWELLRRHGFVQGDWRACDANTRTVVELLAADLMAELAESDFVRFSSRDDAWVVT